MSGTNSLAELQELLAKCTPPPWYWFGASLKASSVQTPHPSDGDKDEDVLWPANALAEIDWHSPHAWADALGACGHHTEPQAKYNAELLVAAINALPGLLSALTTTAQDEAPVCICGLPMSKNPHPDAGKPERLLEVGATYCCIACTCSALHKANMYRYAAERERDEARAERDGLIAKIDQLRLWARTNGLTDKHTREQLMEKIDRAFWDAPSVAQLSDRLTSLLNVTIPDLESSLTAVQQERDALRAGIDTRALARQIFTRLEAIGCGIGNASVPFIDKEIQEFLRATLTKEDER